MKYFIFVFLFVSFPTFAATETGFFETIGQTLNDVSESIIGLPQFIYDFIAKASYYFIYWKIKSQIFMLTISYEISSSFIENLHVTEMLNLAFSNLPPSVGHFVNLLEIPDCISFLLECVSTRFVFNFMGSK